MRNIKLVNEELDLELDLNIKDNWNDITLEDYFKVIDLDPTQNEDKYLIDMISILSGCKVEDLMDIPAIEMEKLTDVFNIFGNLDFPLVDHLEIDGDLYVCKKNMTNITNGEVIMIKNIQKDSKTTKDIYLGILSVLIRPGYIKDDNGVNRYIQHRLDIDELESRKELFLKKLKVDIAVPIVQAFTNGTKK